MNRWGLVSKRGSNEFNDLPVGCHIFQPDGYGLFVVLHCIFFFSERDALYRASRGVMAYTSENLENGQRKHRLAIGRAFVDQHGGVGDVLRVVATRIE
jgi:hypothetical protein